MKPTIEDQKRFIEEYLNELTDEQVELLYPLLNGNFKYNWFDDELMKKLGFVTFDTAKPQPFMDKLREIGVPNEMLEGTVYDYTTAMFGQLESAYVRFAKYVIKTLAYDPR